MFNYNLNLALLKLPLDTKKQSISCYLIKTFIIAILLHLETPNTMYIT